MIENEFGIVPNSFFLLKTNFITEIRENGKFVV